MFYVSEFQGLLHKQCGLEEMIVSSGFPATQSFFESFPTFLIHSKLKVVFFTLLQLAQEQNGAPPRSSVKGSLHPNYKKKKEKILHSAMIELLFIEHYEKT